MYKYTYLNAIKHENNFFVQLYEMIIVCKVIFIEYQTRLSSLSIDPLSVITVLSSEVVDNFRYILLEELQFPLLP